MSRICAIIQKLESTEFVVDFVTTAGAVATDDEDDDERKSENGKVKSENYPPPPSLRSLPSVAMEIATLQRKSETGREIKTRRSLRSLLAKLFPPASKRNMARISWKGSFLVSLSVEWQ
jgi:hypothetical protein